MTLEDVAVLKKGDKVYTYGGTYWGVRRGQAWVVSEVSSSESGVVLFVESSSGFRTRRAIQQSDLSNWSIKSLPNVHVN